MLLLIHTAVSVTISYLAGWHKHVTGNPSQSASMQHCAGAADSPQGSPGLHRLLFRWLTESSNLVNGASNSLWLFCYQVSWGTYYDTMEQEFEDIDSSGKWQNLYNVSRDTGPLVFLWRSVANLLSLLANLIASSLDTFRGVVTFSPLYDSCNCVHPLTLPHCAEALYNAMHSMRTNEKLAVRAASRWLP